MSLPICLGKVKLSQMRSQCFHMLRLNPTFGRGRGGRVIYCKCQRVRVDVGPYGHSFWGC